MKVKAIGHHNLPLPKLMSEGAAGYDLRATSKVNLYPHCQFKISTGFAFEIPKGYVGIIKDRSSYANKRIYTSAGVIDSDYRGELKVLLRNDSSDSLFISQGDRVAQLVILLVACFDVEEVNDISETNRGSGGFGSTGKD